MGGSLRNPASFCNVVGLRPSPGRVPQWPTLNPYNALTVVGPMGRTVADVALLLAAMAGPDARDPLSIDQDPARFMPAPHGLNAWPAAPRPGRWMRRATITSC